jgi:hypothetical protein
MPATLIKNFLSYYWDFGYAAAVASSLEFVYGCFRRG